jgi:hypothetical protein
LSGDHGVFRLASRILFFVGLLRVAAVVSAAGAALFGIYVLVSESILLGLVWIVVSVALGWVINLLLVLVHMLASAAVTAPVRGSLRR